MGFIFSKVAQTMIYPGLSLHTMKWCYLTSSVLISSSFLLFILSISKFFRPHLFPIPFLYSNIPALFTVKERNIHGKIFGGYLMKEAFELAWIGAVRMNTMLCFALLLLFLTSLNSISTYYITFLCHITLIYELYD